MIKVRDLSKAWPDFALEQVNLQVRPGEYFLLLGPTGSGKTLLLETLAGLHHADRGRIQIAQIDVTHQPPEKRGIGFVYQRSLLFPHLSAAENIAFGLKYHRVSAAERTTRVRQTADVVGAAHLLERDTRELSGGEAQLVALARALAIRPRVLLLDEPLGFLDRPTKDMLQDILRGLHSRLGTTTIHVTHDRDVARQLADRLAILQQGRIVQVGSVAEVFDRPADAFVATFLGADNILSGRSRRLGPGRVRIELDGAALEIDGEIEGPVGLTIRSDRIQVSPDRPADDRPAYRAVVQGVRDEGPILRLQVRFGEALLDVRVSRTDYAKQPYPVGRSIFLTIPTEAVHLFAA